MVDTIGSSCFCFPPQNRRRAAAEPPSVGISWAEPGARAEGAAQRAAGAAEAPRARRPGAGERRRRQVPEGVDLWTFKKQSHSR